MSRDLPKDSSWLYCDCKTRDHKHGQFTTAEVKAKIIFGYNSLQEAFCGGYETFEKAMDSISREHPEMKERVFDALLAITEFRKMKKIQMKLMNALSSMQEDDDDEADRGNDRENKRDSKDSTSSMLRRLFRKTKTKEKPSE